MIKLYFHSVFSTRFSCVPITHHFNILRILYFHFSLILQIFFTILIIRGYKWICCAKIFSLFQRKPSIIYWFFVKYEKITLELYLLPIYKNLWHRFYSSVPSSTLQIYTVKLQWKRDTCKKCTLYKYRPITNERENVYSKILLMKSSKKLFIFSFACYLMIWLMISPKKFFKKGLLKIWQLVFLWDVKSNFGRK